MGILSLKTVNRKKDKRSKAKNKSNDDQVPEVKRTGTLPSLVYDPNYPFRHWSDKENFFFAWKDDDTRGV